MELSLRWRWWTRFSGNVFSSPSPARRTSPAIPALAPQQRDIPGPRGLSVDELERLGLRVAVRPFPGLANGDGTVRRVYCLSCGMQIDASGQDQERPEWWRCGRGCNEPATD
jgi:hypothetical protein